LLQGKIALVTGASRGIGAGIAAELARNGAHVIINHLETQAAAESVAERIRLNGGSATVRGFDVSDANAVRESIAALGGEIGPIEIVVNNAGILRDRSFAKMSIDEWNEVVAVNMNGAMHVCSAVVGSMTSRGYGRIVNIASFVAQAGNFGQTNYAASKAGMIGFSRALALELASHGVTVNCVCPGFIETDMWRSIPERTREAILARIPLGRVGSVSDVASVVRFLVVEGAYVTGQTFNVNGGLFIG
jgi:acetoacetyl-CoA reductase